MSQMMKKKSGLWRPEEEITNHSRRKFLAYTSATLALSGLVLSGCNDDDVGMMVDNDESVVNLGTGDIAVLNYAFALEQLEADFYTRVVASFNNGSLSANGETRTILTDFYKHEVIHREFLRAALGDAAIPDLTFKYDEGLFNSLDSVLATAKALEDTGVRAYNGAGQFFSNTESGKLFLLLAGKIVSVEARHASAVRDLLNPNSADFAGDDIINEKGLEVTANPVDILPVVASFVVNQIDASGFPNGGMVSTQIAKP